MKHGNRYIKNLVLSAMFLALGIVLPFVTGQVPQVGSMLLPMHIPVLLCGFICGWQYGGVVGFVLPLLRHLMFGMPPLLTAVAMAFELAVYGIVTGLLYRLLPRKNVVSLYISLISAMLLGRVVWGVVCVVMTGVAGEVFTWKLFLAGAFVNAVPGIILQLVLIPALMVILGRAGLVQYDAGKKKQSA